MSTALATTGVRFGETRRANEIGLSGYHKMVWLECPSCHQGRWTPEARPSRTCIRCMDARRQPRPNQSERQRGDKNHMWKGGLVRGGNGYVYELVSPDDSLRCMANKTGYAMQHRLVVARHLGRPLYSWEQVHHRNGNRTDNTPANLELWKRSQPSGVRQADCHCSGCRCLEVN